MKKILFFIESLYCGGAEKSLLSLLNNLDYSRYDIHLMVAKRGGEFEQFVPSHLKIEKASFHPSIFSRVKFKIARVLNSPRKYHNAQLYWRATRNEIPCIKEKYDIAIAWGQGSATYFVAEKIDATKKYAWLNTDYDKAGYNFKADADKYAKFDKVIGISEFVETSMHKYLSKDKIISIRNIIDEDDITVKANSEIPFKFDKSKNNILSIGRLAKPKGFESSVLAANILRLKNHNFHWYVIGEGSERMILEKLIQDHQLQNYFTLLGLIENPYPYIKQSDIYVQTSKFEGLGRTLIEAGILNKPVVTTNFPTAFEIFEHNETALITEMDPASIAKAIEKIVVDANLKNKLIKNLKNRKDNEKERTLAAVYGLLE